MKTIIKNIPDAEITKMEALTYEIGARKDIIAFMIDKNMTDSDSFNTYYNEYMKFYKEFDFAKNNISEKYVATEYPNCVWNLNFYTRELEIYVNEE